MVGSGWTFDGTLAHYVRGDWDKHGPTHIGEPVPRMVKRVRAWLAEGRDVRIMTARVCPDNERNMEDILHAISVWCKKHVGRILPVTCMKDPDMIILYDDRCIQVEPNTGRLIEESSD